MLDFLFLILWKKHQLGILYKMAISMEEKLYYVALGMIPNIGGSYAKQLISYCGGAKAIFKKKKHQLLKIPGVGASIAEAIQQTDLLAILKKADAELEFCFKEDIAIITYNEKAFPQRLNHCSDAPYLIYVKGNANLNAERMLSVVGTRNATSYGRKTTEDFIADIQPSNATIVSGLAYGIDTYAHKAALSNDLPTVAVLAHGLHTIYPSANRKLAEDIVANGGALITEFRNGQKPDKQNFPSRNRIVAGMCQGTLVVESAAKGGALITAEIAQSYNRDVFAVPGKVQDKYSIGCNNLIKRNVAAMVTSGKDVLTLLNWDAENAPQKQRAIQQSLFVELNEMEQTVVDFLSQKIEPLHMDDLSHQLQMPNSTLSANLLNLELKGVIQTAPGNCYQLV